MNSPKLLFLRVQIKYITLIAFLFLSQIGLGQQTGITYLANEKPLNEVLEDISAGYNIKFAYDPDSFRKIITSFDIKGNSVEHFLNLIHEEYFIQSKFIEGTWVLVYREPKKILNLNPVPEPQEITVNGYVKDKVTGENLMYCNVVFGPSSGAMTNPLGFFSFDMPKTDSVHILISHLGYKRLDTLISTATTVTLFLIPSEILMKEVEVTQVDKKILEASPQPDKIGFNPLKSANAPRISSDDMANALLLIPGVNFIQGGSSGLSIRGGDPTDNLILFDGIPVLETSHLLGSMSVLNAKFIQQAFVSRGGFDAEFGGRVSGLIELTGKSGKNNQPYLDISANLLNTNVLANVPVSEKLSVTTAWRRSFIDQWRNYLYMRFIDDSPSENSDNTTVTTSIFPDMKYQDVNTKISFHPSEKLEFNLNLLYGTDNQSRDYELIQTKDYYRTEFMESENIGFSFNWEWQINPYWYQSMSAGYSKLDKQMVDETGELQEVTEITENPGQGVGIGKGLTKTKEKTYTTQVYDIDDGTNNVEEYRLAWKTELKTGIFRNQAGIGFTSNAFNYELYANRTLAEIPIDSIENKASQQLVNGFLQQHIRVDEKLKFRWGMRSNLDINTHKFYWQPRGGVEFYPIPEMEIHFLSGIYYQFLSGIKRIDSEGHFNPVWYLPDKDGNGVVHAVHYVLGGRYEKNGWMINAEGYIKKSDGKISLFAEEVIHGNNQTIVYSPKEGNEHSKGVDLFIQKKHGMFNHMIGYSLAKTEEQITDILNNSWFPGYNDRLHRLKVTEMLTWKNWYLTGSWNISSGLPVVNLTEDDLLSNVERSDYFSQLDFSLAKKIYMPHVLINAGVSLLNVLNKDNIIKVDYLRFASDNGSISVRSDISALSFTPLFFLDIKFH